METPTRYTGVSVHNLNSQTPYRTPVGATAHTYRIGSHSVASSSTRGGTLQRAGASQALTPPAHGWTGAYESPLPLRPAQDRRGAHLSAARLFGDQVPLLSDGGIDEDEDDDELFTRYSDLYYDPNGRHRPYGQRGLFSSHAGGHEDDLVSMSSHRRGCCGAEGGACVRAVLLFVNILLLLASAAALLVGLVARQSLEDALKNLCHDCTRLYNVYLMYTCVLALAALIGCLMLLMPHRAARDCVVRCGDLCTWRLTSCCRALYMAVLTLVLVALGGWLLAYTLVLHGRVDLSEAWDRSVTANRTDVCFIEYRLECNGWEETCPAVVSPPLSLSAPSQHTPTLPCHEDDAHLTAPRRLSCWNEGAVMTAALPLLSASSTPDAVLQRTLCPLNCPAYMQAAIDNFTRPCADVVKHHVRAKAHVLLVPSTVMATVVLLSLITACVSACASSRRDEDPTDLVARQYTSSASAPRMTVSVVED